MQVYIGTYTRAKSQGIYLSEFDLLTGKLGAPVLAAEAKNPSFLAFHPNRRFLFSVSEMSGGQRAGAVTAFSRDALNGKLTLLNQQPSGGAGPCHLALDRSGQCLLVANYGSGSISALPIQADGKLGAPATQIQHEGSSVNPQRQAGPHAHFITPDPDNRFALTCDLGLDKVLVYRLDPSKSALTPNLSPSISVEPGSGPRHLAFHPNGRFVYLINEMSSTLSVLTYEPQTGTLKEIQTLSSLPANYTGPNTCAEVQVHPSGKFVYGSNRGHNSIVSFTIDAKTGKLALLEHQSTQGKTPRHFTLVPTGDWLLAENQDSDNIVVFRVDSLTGHLTSTGQTIEVGSPVCVVFAPVE